MRQLIAAVVILIGMLEAHGAVAETVDVELVLVADASWSIDDAESRFQHQGYAAKILVVGDGRRFAAHAPAQPRSPRGCPGISW